MSAANLQGADSPATAYAPDRHERDAKARGRHRGAQEAGQHASPAPQHIAADLRTVRILQILAERSDARNGLTSTQIQEALAHPDDPRHPVIEAGRSTIRRSINTLRALGFSIDADNHQGYSLVSRPLDEDCIELIVSALRCSRVLTPAQRARCMEQVIGLAPATQRARLRRKVLEERAGRAPRASRAYTYRLESAERVIRCSIVNNLPLSYELSDTGAAGYGADVSGVPGRYGARWHIEPNRVLNLDHAAYLAGRASQLGTPTVAADRLVRINRLANLACIDGQVVVHIAFGTA